VLKTGKKVAQTGTHEDNPHKSREEAFEHLKHMVASLKAAKEHPIVQSMRDEGIDPKEFKLLRVRHEKFGQRWFVLLADEETPKRAALFSEQFSGRSVVDKLLLARQTILDYAVQFATDDPCIPSLDTKYDKVEYDKADCAAAFLSANGVINIDQKDCISTTSTTLH